ncbi:MAG: hypothetical protein IJJ85_08445, partial [Clostridia bacterium]|nr:hypothetical protein [Clostridia bacterium]
IFRRKYGGIYGRIYERQHVQPTAVVRRAGGDGEKSQRSAEADEEKMRVMKVLKVIKVKKVMK